jgi:hypothetical protein
MGTAAVALREELRRLPVWVKPSEVVERNREVRFALTNGHGQPGLSDRKGANRRHHALLRRISIIS